MKIDKLIYPATIIIASIIIGGSLYAVQVNKQNSIEKQQGLDLEQKQALLQVGKQKEEKCREIGEKAYQEYQRMIGSNTDFDMPIYVYSFSLDTCLYSGGYWTNSYWESWVKDAYTNKEYIFISNFPEFTLKDENLAKLKVEEINDFNIKFKEIMGVDRPKSF